MTKKIDLQALPEKFSDFGKQAIRFRVPVFIVVSLIIYGFLAYRIETLYNQAPSQGSIDAQTSPVAVTHVDKTVVNQMLKLQDNSVSVQTLFQQARNDPFQD